jgi:hypothetical protein
MRLITFLGLSLILVGCGTPHQPSTPNTAAAKTAELSAVDPIVQDDFEFTMTSIEVKGTRTFSYEHAPSTFDNASTELAVKLLLHDMTGQRTLRLASGAAITSVKDSRGRQLLARGPANLTTEYDRPEFAAPGTRLADGRRFTATHSLRANTRLTGLPETIERIEGMCAIEVAEDDHLSVIPLPLAGDSFEIGAGTAVVRVCTIDMATQALVNFSLEVSARGSATMEVQSVSIVSERGDKITAKLTERVVVGDNRRWRFSTGGQRGMITAPKSLEVLTIAGIRRFSIPFAWGPITTGRMTQDD